MQEEVSLNNKIFLTDRAEEAFLLAIKKAKLFQGSTWPNPPVGAAGIDLDGNILALAAHEKAGTPHAEVHVIDAFQKAGILEELHTLIITLEPCNHYGKTPPCTEAILRTNIKKVIFGVKDPNPKVSGKGAERLREAGLEVIEIEEGWVKNACRELIASFAYSSQNGKPWITLKRALRTDGSMIPPIGKKTFTSREALVYAHQLRKRADAILTGSGTILADDPEFTVRHVKDHPEKKRYLVILDRRKRISKDWLEKAEQRGFQVITGMELEAAVDFLAKQGVLEVLVEAGPTLSASILEKKLWQEHVEITENGGILVHRSASIA